jgi:hypothetical protein
MKKISLVVLLLVSIYASSNACWSVFNPAGTSILAKHTETKSGSVAFEVYFIANDQAIALFNLNQPDIQALSKMLTDAYQTGKKINYIGNSTRSSRAASWLPLNISGWTCQMYSGSSVTFYDIYSQDQMILRTKS